jgi:hypothetical protein
MISSITMVVALSMSAGMWTSPQSMLIAKSVTDKNPNLSRREVIVIGALIERLKRFSVVTCISQFISSAS